MVPFIVVGVVRDCDRDCDHARDHALACAEDHQCLNQPATCQQKQQQQNSGGVHGAPQSTEV